MVNLERLPEGGRRVLIGANPCAGAQNRRALVEALSEELARRGFEPTVHGDIDGLAAEAARLLPSGELRAVVAAGGDGTFRLIAERTPPATPLLVLPLGTENLLARYIGFTPEPTELAKIIADGYTMSLDAGMASSRLF